MNRDVVAMLESLSLHLKADDRDGYAATVSQAAQAIRDNNGTVPPNPAELDGVGPRLREIISEYQIRGKCDELQELKNKYPYLSTFTKLNSVGPTRARRMHEELGISEISEVVDADLESVHGIGSKTANKIRGSARRLQQH